MLPPGSNYLLYYVNNLYYKRLSTLDLNIAILATSAQVRLRQQHPNNFDFAEFLDRLRITLVFERGLNTVKGIHHVLIHSFSLCSNWYVDFFLISSLFAFSGFSSSNSWVLTYHNFEKNGAVH